MTDPTRSGLRSGWAPIALLAMIATVNPGAYFGSCAFVYHVCCWLLLLLLKVRKAMLKSWHSHTLQ
jgi:hypothetical protein